jgi:chemotaxis protein MotB
LPIKENLEERLAGMLGEGKVSISLHSRGLVLSLREGAFFPIGKAAFRAGAEELLQQINDTIGQIPMQPIRLEGHTDNVPIHNDEFASNWDLSSWRAIEVMNLLIDRFGIAPARLSVVGYGELRPVADNDSAQGRAANRRVDIVILSRSAAAMAPRQ